MRALKCLIVFACITAFAACGGRTAPTASDPQSTTDASVNNQTTQDAAITASDATTANDDAHTATSDAQITSDGAQAADANTPVDGNTPPDSSVPPSDSSIPTSDATPSNDTITGQVVVEVAPATQVAGDTITVTIRNDTNAVVFLKGCPTVVFERRHDGTWNAEDVDRYCIWEGTAVAIEPGQTETRNTFISAAGVWRANVLYGIGCAADHTLSSAGCDSHDNAFSAPFVITSSAVTTALCQTIAETYATLIGPSRLCNPFNENACKTLAGADLVCQCPIYVNDDSVLSFAADAWSALNCASALPCDTTCPAGTPATATCVNGICQ